MKLKPYYALLLAHVLLQNLAAEPSRHWPLDEVNGSLTIRGSTKIAAGASGKSLVLDGDWLIELNDSAKSASGAFTVSLWFNPYDLAGRQQMLAGKNRYSRNERQWSITIEPNGKLKAFLWQNGWRTISCPQPLKAGAWHLATLVVGQDKAALFLNGKPAGVVKLETPIAATPSPITLGGIWDRETVRQAFDGALDEFSHQPRALNAKEVAAAYRPVSALHDVLKLAAGLPLWDATQTLPGAAELPQVAGAEFHVIKKRRPDTDGAKWTLGVGLAWHKEKLYASYGYNKGNENTATEEAHVKVSNDGGKSWGPPVVMDAGEGGLGVSHGVFLSHQDKLWAFMGAFYAHTQLYHRVHTRAYTLNETSGQWEPRGPVLEGGFWPMQEPLKMPDGNWIMSGFRIDSQYGGPGNLPAVAISQGDDFTKWDLVVIPAAGGLGNIWGESTVIVEDKRILNIARYGKRPKALFSVSEDHGRTWTPAAVSNLPMATSKPYAGILSTGQRYLVCTTTANTGSRRTPLTIAVSQPGESAFSKVFLIRTSVSDQTPGVSARNADFSYPYAIEHEGKLYIGYTHKSHAANELAVVPVSSLEIKP
ncbi:MAG: cycloinulo-oligosaccharide fructanotransferase [Planctomycetaceae bacterium]|nr:cycloinulo-oligosaccharide fructanotransferase [Planctomycetaceae bacterium]